jgi:hypothetical protein
MDPAVVEMVKAGGTIAFAAAVWYELRMQRIERNAIDARQDAQLSAVREGMATLTEAVRSAFARRPIPTPQRVR